MKIKLVFINLLNQFFNALNKNHLLALNLSIILVLALIFRVYQYSDRMHVYADNSLFVQTAFYAFANHKIPQVGTFAQGPFFTGPWWLWILSATYIFPFGIWTPWYFMTMLSLIFILLLFLVGYEIGGRKLGQLSAFLGAISTAQIDNSFMTWNATADPFLALLAIYLLLLFRKNSHPIPLFLLGFVISLAISIHFQTFFLIGLIFIALFTKKPKVTNIIALLIGSSIPLLPFLYFDLRFNWFETRRILDYIFIGQYRIYVPNRWLTYIGSFWPQSWAWIIGGKNWLGYVLMLLITLLGVLRIKDIKKHISYYLIAIAFIISVILLRYYRGERFFYYTNYAHGFVLIITSWAVFEVYKIRKFFGSLLIIVITLCTLQRSVENFKPRVITADQVINITQEIYQKYPSDSTFDIYECPFQSSMLSTPVSYKMYYDGRSPGGGIKIGVCNKDMQLSWRELQVDEVDRQYGYQNKSTPAVYKSITEWWIENPPYTLW